MAQLVVQKVSLNGTSITFGAADVAGDTFSNDGNTKLRVKNGGAAAATVTIASTRPCSQGFTHDVVDSVAAGADIEIGPFSPLRFNNSQNNVSITYSDATSLTVAAVR